MDKVKIDKYKNKPNEQIAKKEYLKKITYTQSKNETLDLLDIVELFLCKACVKL